MGIARGRLQEERKSWRKACSSLARLLRIAPSSSHPAACLASRRTTRMASSRSRNRCRMAGRLVKVPAFPCPRVGACASRCAWPLGLARPTKGRGRPMIGRYGAASGAPVSPASNRCRFARWPSLASAAAHVAPRRLLTARLAGAGTQNLMKWDCVIPGKGEPRDRVRVRVRVRVRGRVRVRARMSL